MAPRSLSFLSYKIRTVAQLCSLDSGGLTEGKAGRGLANFNVGRVNLGHAYQAVVLTTCVCVGSVVRRQVNWNPMIMVMVMIKAFFTCFIGAQETPELLSVTAAFRGRRCYCNPHLWVGKLRLREISMG